MNTLKWIAVAVGIALLGGCATKATQPDWVSGRSAKYPDTEYLLGRGSATGAEEAGDRARADLAKVFEVAVSVESEDVQRYRSVATGAEFEASASRRIRTRTDQIVRGIRIADLWDDPRTRTQHALAVLPRLQAANGLRQQIEMLDAATRSHLEQARNAQDLFVKIGAAAAAIDAQVERAAVQKSLRVVDVTGRGTESEWNLAKLGADLGDLLKRVRLAVRADGTPPEGFATALRGAAAAAGFLAETGDKPDFVLAGRLDLEDLGKRDGWHWQRGTLEISLAETAGGRVRGSKRWPIKASAADAGTALQRAVGEADTVLKKELRATLVGFAAGGGS
jgi:hypothetical protein